jgi:tetratricopeptide (TPR) repeat protein
LCEVSIISTCLTHALSHFGGGHSPHTTAGHHDLAIASFDLAIALDPAFAEAFFSRGLALEAIKQLEAALVDFDRALIFSPEHHEARMHQDSLLRILGRI